MGLREFLITVVVLLPLVGVVACALAGSGISERHHAHHDTYAVSLVVSHTLLLVMTFMGVLGGLTAWLCHIGVFTSDALVPLAFFTAFQVTLLLILIMTVRYRVVAYDDRLTVFPPLGRRRTISYDSIDHMEWVRSFFAPHFHDLCIYTKERRVVRIWYLLDIGQMLLRVDRFELMEG